MTTLGQALDGAARRLAARSGTPRLDARVLLAHAAGLAPEALAFGAGRAFEGNQELDFQMAVARRLAGEPVSRITGRREFWSLDFAVTPAVLDPRPDSETLIEALLAARPERDAPSRLLDLGTGSGCLLLAALSEYPRGWGLGTDRSAAAAAAARANAARLGMAHRASFAVGDWGAALDGRFDAVLCNPPYISAADMARLPCEVADHDPHLALDGGADGLDAYRRLMPVFVRAVSPSGIVLVELGAGQAEPVGAIADVNGLAVHASRHDLSGVARCLVLRPKHAP